ncbi:pteridine-dependent deoxygenase [Dokdonella sp.]|uniref:chorismate transformation enzyme, FkbO/Hyg5 family n=1 Tax=Dokdonella sp. TaxID=2291710 RepID=UPI00326332F2
MTAAPSSATSLGVGYERASINAVLQQPGVLAVIGFGGAMPIADDPRVLRIGLEPVQAGWLEVWRGGAGAEWGSDADLRWSTDGIHLFFAIDVVEADHGGIVGATEHAYRRINAFVGPSATPHVLRLWNYLDAINLGDGDDERYRLFCEGRARGMRVYGETHYPAASAIGRQDGVRILQVYGLASRIAGVPIENPRQTSAWRYPRRYGPVAPTFARGMLASSSQLLISGTAAVVGHASRHDNDLAAQVEETLANLESLLTQAGVAEAELGADSCLKIYLRDPSCADFVIDALGRHAPTLPEPLVLAGDICRAELLVEIDGMHGVAR